MNKNNDAPCYGCDERQVDAEHNCHAVCERFIAWKEEQAAQKKSDAEKRRGDYVYAGYEAKKRQYISKVKEYGTRKRR